jgi:hypothetical protein
MKLLATKARPWAYILAWAGLLAVAAESAQEHDRSSLLFIAVAAVGFFVTTEFTVLDRVRVRMMVEDELDRIGYPVKVRPPSPEQVQTRPVYSSSYAGVGLAKANEVVSDPEKRRPPTTEAPFYGGDLTQDLAVVRENRKLYDHEDDETAPDWPGR